MRRRASDEEGEARRGHDSPSDKAEDVRGAVKHKINSALDGVFAAEKAAKADEGGARHHRGRHGESSASSHKKKMCNPLAGLYSTGTVTWC